jgi:hypothetical protein
MTHDHAVRLLMQHAGTAGDTDDVGYLESGFLGGLRPYRGLREDNFHLVMEALLTVGERLHKSPLVERDLVQTLWSLCYYARL